MTLGFRDQLVDLCWHGSNGVAADVGRTPTTSIWEHNWLLVWNMNGLWLSTSWEFHHPNWLWLIFFQRGWNHQPAMVLHSLLTLPHLYCNSAGYWTWRLELLGTGMMRTHREPVWIKLCCVTLYSITPTYGGRTNTYPGHCGIPLKLTIGEAYQGFYKPSKSPKNFPWSFTFQ